MKIRVIVLIVGISFLLNGCLADKIRERVYYLKMRDSKHKQAKSKTRIGKLHKEAKVQEEVIQKRFAKSNTIRKKPLYMPSKAEPIEQTEEVEIVPLEEKKITRKKVTKKKIVIKEHKEYTKKRVKHKKTVKKVVKKTEQKLEPYSIESDENDPELLGPQTTLESNPLKKDIDKI